MFRPALISNMILGILFMMNHFITILLSMLLTLFYHCGNTMMYTHRVSVKLLNIKKQYAFKIPSNSKTLHMFQGRIQDFHGGGGGSKRLAHYRREARRALEALRVICMLSLVLSELYFLSIMIQNGIKKHSRSNLRGLTPVALPSKSATVCYN